MPFLVSLWEEIYGQVKKRTSNTKLSFDLSLIRESRGSGNIRTDSQNPPVNRGTSMFKAKDRLRPPDSKTLHLDLSSWLKNMDKLSNSIDRFQELASAAPSDDRPQLHSQVVELRATFAKQQGRYIEFLRLTEEYATRYVDDISAEIRQQSSFLDMLEKRLDRAKALHGKAVELRNSYESDIVDAMKNICKTVLSQPLPEDFDLLSEIDFALGEIRRCYMELDKFWTEEIHRAIKALKTWRVDPDDVERWRDYKENLNQTIASWETQQHGGGIWSTTRNSPVDSSGTNLGAIASSLSHALGTLKERLQKVCQSASMEFSHMNLSPLLRVNLGLMQNRKFGLAFFRKCVEFWEMIVTSSSAFIAYPAFSRIKSSNDLRDRANALGTEGARPSVEIVPQSRGSPKFNSAYEQALSLQGEMTLGLNTLLESFSSWTSFVDDIPNVQPGWVSVSLLRNLALTWANGRASIRSALGDLTGDPAEQLRYRSLSLTSPPPHPRSSMTRRMLGMVTVYFKLRDTL